MPHDGHRLQKYAVRDNRELQHVEGLANCMGFIKPHGFPCGFIPIFNQPVGLRPVRLCERSATSFSYELCELENKKYSCSEAIQSMGNAERLFVGIICYPQVTTMLSSCHLEPLNLVILNLFSGSLVDVSTHRLIEGGVSFE